MYNRIKAIRTALGFSQTDFARQLGLKQNSLSMMETGKNPIIDKNIKLICSTFSVNENWLRTGEGEMFDHNPDLQELMGLYGMLTPDVRKYLLEVAKGLYDIQQKLLDFGQEDSE